MLEGKSREITLINSGNRMDESCSSSLNKVFGASLCKITNSLHKGIYEDNRSLKLAKSSRNDVPSMVKQIFVSALCTFI